MRLLAHSLYVINDWLCGFLVIQFHFIADFFFHLSHFVSFYRCALCFFSLSSYHLYRHDVSHHISIFITLYDFTFNSITGTFVPITHAAVYGIFINFLSIYFAHGFHLNYFKFITQKKNANTLREMSWTLIWFQNCTWSYPKTYRMTLLK